MEKQKMSNNYECKEHSGCVAKIQALEKSDDIQWHAIEELRKTNDNQNKTLNKVFGAVIVTLIAVLGSFIATWAKTGGTP